MLLTTTTLTCGYYKAYPDNVYPDKAYLGLSQSLPTQQCLPRQSLPGAITKLTHTMLTWGYHKAYLDDAYQDKAYLGLLRSLPTQSLPGAITKLTHTMLTQTKLNYQGLSQSLPRQSPLSAKPHRIRCPALHDRASACCHIHGACPPCSKKVTMFTLVQIQHNQKLSRCMTKDLYQHQSKLTSFFTVTTSNTPTHTHTHTHTHTNAHRHAHIHACTPTHACTHAHTHTHTPDVPRLWMQLLLHRIFCGLHSGQKAPSKLQLHHNCTLMWTCPFLSSFWFIYTMTEPFCGHVHFCPVSVFLLYLHHDCALLCTCPFLSSFCLSDSFTQWVCPFVHLSISVQFVFLDCAFLYTCPFLPSFCLSGAFTPWLCPDKDLSISV